MMSARFSYNPVKYINIKFMPQLGSGLCPLSHPEILKFVLEKTFSTP